MKVAILQVTDFNNSHYKNSIESVQSSLPFISENHDCHHIILMNGSYRVDLSVDNSKTTLVDSENKYHGCSGSPNTLCRVALDLGFEAVILVDDDMIVPENDWASDFITPYETDEDVVMTGINALINRSDLMNQWYRDSSNESFDYLDTPLSFLLSHWSDIGGWDENFILGCANTDFCLRTWASGKKIFQIINKQEILHYSHSTTGNKNHPPLLKNILSTRAVDADNSFFLEKHGVNWREKYNRTHIVERGLPMYFIDSDVSDIKHRLYVYGVDLITSETEAKRISNYPTMGPNDKISSVSDLRIPDEIKEKIQSNTM